MLAFIWDVEDSPQVPFKYRLLCCIEEANETNSKPATLQGGKQSINGSAPPAHSIKRIIFIVLFLLKMMSKSWS